MSYCNTDKSQDIVVNSELRIKYDLIEIEEFFLMEMSRSRGPGEESSYFLPTLEQ